MCCRWIITERTDITEKVKTVIGEKSETREKKVPVDVAVLFDKDHHRSLKAGKMEKKRDQVKIKQFGKDSFSIGRENVDLKICRTNPGCRTDNGISVLPEESAGRNGTEGTGC